MMHLNADGKDVPRASLWGGRVLLMLLLGVLAAFPPARALAQEEEDEQGVMPEALNEDLTLQTEQGVRKNAYPVLAAFGEVAAHASASVATVFADGEAVSLGTVVDAKGLLVAKACRLKDAKVSCRLADGRRWPAVVLGVDDKRDLALLKVAPTNLVPIVWREGAPPESGHWVVSAGISGAPLAVGVVSAKPRSARMVRQDRERGFLGVQLQAGMGEGVQVIEIVPESAAEEAGIEAGDVIKRIAEEPVQSVKQAILTLGGSAPGTRVKIEIDRKGKPLTVEPTLRTRRKMPSPELRWGGGPFSRRRYGFPEVIPHDTVLLPKDCGGPLLDLEGHAVGLNIARALRVASYALGAGDVRKAVAKLEAQAPADATVDAHPIDEGDTGAATGSELATAEEGKPPIADVDEMQLQRRWLEAIHKRDADALEQVTAELMERHPELKAEMMVRSAQIYLGLLGDDKRGYALADKLADKSMNVDKELLNELSWFIFTDKSLKKRDLERGMKLARLAMKRSKGRDAAILDTLARGHFEMGDLDTAITVQKRAVKRARGQTRPVVKETLDRYEQARKQI